MTAVLFACSKCGRHVWEVRGGTPYCFPCMDWCVPAPKEEPHDPALD